MNRRKFLSKLVAIPPALAAVSLGIAALPSALQRLAQAFRPGIEAEPRPWFRLRAKDPSHQEYANQVQSTLLDQIKRTDPHGSISVVVEELSARNPILVDAVERPTRPRITVRSGLPPVKWRELRRPLDEHHTEIQEAYRCRSS
jgi:hypothetical protein